MALSWASREVEQRRRKDQLLIRLLDGQHSLWETAALCCDVPAESVVEVLDVLPVAGYVWQAAKVFQTHREHQEAFARDRLLRILQGDAKGVVSGLRRMATHRGLSGAARKEIDTVSSACRPAFRARSQRTADSDPAAHNNKSHSAVNNSSRIRGQPCRFGSLTGGHGSAVVTDQVTSPPPVTRTNSGSIRRAASASACPLTMASRLPPSSGHQSAVSSSL